MLHINQWETEKAKKKITKITAQKETEAQILNRLCVFMREVNFFTTDTSVV
jgi:hypothetical protein